VVPPVPARPTPGGRYPVVVPRLGEPPLSFAAAALAARLAGAFAVVPQL
jgi:hypothetical protein